MALVGLRRYGRLAAVPVALAALTVAGCTTAPAHPAAPGVASHRPADPLQPVGPSQSGFSYTLLDASSCQVGDGIAIVADQGTAPIVIKQVVVNVTGADRRALSMSYRLLTFKNGSTDGEIAASFHLAVLRNALSSQPATGATLLPVASSKRWYDIVAQLSERGPQRAKWQITGLTVTYTSGQHNYFAELDQKINLPAAPACHRHR